MAEIKLITTDADITLTFSLMKQLRPHLAEDDYLTLIRRLQHNHGYQLAAIIENGQAKSAAGYRVTESLAWGKYLYVDDLITDADSRANGYAKLLMDWLEAEAAKNDCLQLHLDSGVQRHDAHRFYLNKKMNITGYHFQKNI
jgi:GNAT superfamily N-acetyltransferase